MGNSWTAPNYETASRLVNVLQDRYTLALHKKAQQDTVIERYQRAVRQSDQRIQDFLNQLEQLQAENQELKRQLVNANQVNCTFEKRLIQYQGLLKAQRKQLQFANRCISEKDQILSTLQNKS